MLLKPIKIVAMNGSVRPGNYTGKALKIVTDELRGEKNVVLEVIEPAELELSFPGGREGEKTTARLKNLVKDAAGIVLATPEYNGSFSSVTKAMIESLGYPSALLGKPVVLLGVSAGRLGAIKALEHLQSVCVHIGAIVIPGPVSVSNIFETFNEEGVCRDLKARKRMKSLAVNLLNFIRSHAVPRMALEELSREGD